jgi:hypothetical protein
MARAQRERLEAIEWARSDLNQHCDHLLLLHLALDDIALSTMAGGEYKWHERHDII